MNSQEFIDKYLITYKKKAAKDQENNYTSEHIKEIVKIKSPYFFKPIKCNYSYNPNYTEFDFGNLIYCLSGDCRAVSDGYDGIITLDEFFREWEFSQENIKIYKACKKMFKKCEDAMLDLFEEFLNLEEEC
jgi:hypothetical protein